MPEFKDYVAAAAATISAISVAASGAAAYFAYHANREAADLRLGLDQSRLRADTSVKLLDLAYSSFRTANNPPERKAACEYIQRLGTFEYSVLQTRLITDLHIALSQGQEVDANCRQIGETLVGEAGAALGAQNGDTPPVRSSPDQVGTWHAVIASYDITERGCAFARQDVERFASLLPEQNWRGGKLAIYRTEISRNYAVTLDTGEDRAMAARARDVIREIGVNLRTREGADSFVQENRRWSVDPNCTQQVSL